MGAHPEVIVFKNHYFGVSYKTIKILVIYCVLLPTSDGFICKIKMKWFETFLPQEHSPSVHKLIYTKKLNSNKIVGN